MKIRDLFEVDDVIRPIDPNQLWYHGSDREFTKFDYQEIGSRQGRGPGFWFTDNHDLLGYYGHIFYTVKLRLRNPLIITESMMKAGLSKRQWCQKAMAEGYDSFVIQDIIDGDRESTICSVFNTNQIKIVKVENTYPELDEAYLPLRKGVLANARGNYSALVCVMDPKDFILLTTPAGREREQIYTDKFSTLDTYRKSRKDDFKNPLGPTEANLTQYNMPFLDVYQQTGLVKGHEGRHRAAMVAKAGGTKFPCVINFRTPIEYIVSYNELRFDREKGEFDYDHEINKEEYFESGNESYEFVKKLESNNQDHDNDIYYSNIKTNTIGGYTMKGSPRSNPNKWEFAAWKPSDVPDEFIGQYDSSIRIPTSKMKFGIVKGYHHFKK